MTGEAPVPVNLRFTKLDASNIDNASINDKLYPVGTMGNSSTVHILIQ